MGTLVGFGFGIQTSVALCKTCLELNAGTFGSSLIGASCPTGDLLSFCGVHCHKAASKGYLQRKPRHIKNAAELLTLPHFMKNLKVLLDF